MPLSDIQLKAVKTRRVYNLTVEFIQLKSDTDMIFTNVGDVETANRLVHAMRVKLSRMRGQVRKLGKQLVDFKMRLKSISYEQDGNTSTITLTKTTPVAEVEVEIDNLLKELEINEPK